MRRLDLLVLAALLVLLVAGGAWWLGGGTERRADDAAGVLRRDASDEAASLQKPSIVADSGRDVAATRPVKLDAAGASHLATSDTAAAATDAAGESGADFGEEATLRGRVVDADGAPIAGATVAYYPNEASWAGYHIDWDSRGPALDALPRERTDAGGRFTLHGRFRAGSSIDMQFDVPWLVAISGDLAIRAVRCDDFDGGAFDAGDIVLEPGARFVGRVVDESGRPIEGAHVDPWNSQATSLRKLPGVEPGTRCQVSDAFAGTVSSADGRFLTGALWNGDAGLHVSAPGFVDLRRTALTLHGGEDSDLGDLVLSSGLAIVGVLRDAEGAPVAGARVVAWAPEASDTMRRKAYGLQYDWLLDQLREHERDDGVISDAAGRFVIEALKPVTYSLFVDATGFEPLRLDELLPGAGVLDVRIVRAAMLHLVLVDASSHEPVEHAAVQARRVPGRKGHGGVPVPVTPGDAPGTFLVERIGLRRTELTVSAPGHATTGFVLEGATPPEQVERTLTLAPEARVAGVVTTEDGTPIPQASVLAMWQTPVASAAENPTTDILPTDGVSLKNVEATTDALGRYALGTLVAGGWLVRAVAKDFASVDAPLTLDAGQQVPDLDFELPAAASVFGKQFHADGTPAAKATASFQWVVPAGQRSKEPPHEVVSDAQGRYEVRDLRPGTWAIRGRQEPEITLAPGERRRLDLHESPDARIEGRVLLASGAPVPHAWVFVNCLRAGIAHRFTTFERADDDGHWTWTRGWTGRFDIVAVAPEGGGRMSAPVSFELHPAEQRIVDLRLGSLIVRGRVLRTEDDAPIAGAHVRLVPLLDDDSPGAWSSFSSGDEVHDFACVTDADGRFEATDLSPGRFSVQVDAEGARGMEQPTLNLTADAVPELLIRLTRTGSVRGVVHKASGLPVTDDTPISAEGPGQQAFDRLRDGHFELKNLMPGTWHVFIKELDDVLAEQTITVVSGQQAAMELIVP